MKREKKKAGNDIIPRQVTAAEAQAWAKSKKIPFMETSARSRINIEEAFFELVRLIPRQGVEYKLVIVGAGGVGKVFISFGLYLF